MISVKEYNKVVKELKRLDSVICGPGLQIGRSAGGKTLSLVKSPLDLAHNKNQQVATASNPFTSMIVEHTPLYYAVVRDSDNTELLNTPAVWQYKLWLTYKQLPVIDAECFTAYNIYELNNLWATFENGYDTQWRGYFGNGTFMRKLEDVSNIEALPFWQEFPNWEVKPVPEGAIVLTVKAAMMYVNTYAAGELGYLGGEPASVEGINYYFACENGVWLK